MKLFKKLFGFNTEDTPKYYKLNESFEQDFLNSIPVFQNSKELDDSEIINALVNTGISKDHATEITLFAPVVATEYIFDTIDWMDDYIEMNDNKTTKKKFSKTPSYILLSRLIKNHESLTINTLRNISFRSATFKAMKSLLLENPSTDIDSIVFSHVVIIR